MSILYKNIFHMLAYVFEELNLESFKNVAVEKFNNVENLYAYLLERIVSRELKRGMYKEYNDVEDALITIRGKINISETIKPNLILKRKIYCEFDEYNVNTLINQTIKKALYILLRCKEVAKDIKKKIKNLLFYFKDVELVDVSRLKRKIIYNSVNSKYKFIVNFCHLIIYSLLLTEEEGDKYIKNIVSTKVIHTIYEKFILKYYAKHYKDKIKASSSYIEWVLDNTSPTDYLPSMLSDVMIEDRNSDKVLILDAKHYGTNLKEHYGKLTVNSANMYQIYTYVTNYSLMNPNKTVSGMLLYAKTESEVQPDKTYKMNNHLISVKNLDLNCEFKDIKLQLNNIIDGFFAGNY